MGVSLSPLVRYIQLTLVVLGAVAGGACYAVSTAKPSNTSKAVLPAQRIVSLDYCADQYVLQFAERRHILALSPDAQKPFSYLREQAIGLPQIRPLAEDILIAQPDLIVRSYGGGPSALRFFERSGLKVLQVGYANDLADIKRVTKEMATGLGEADKGTALVADIDRRLQAVQQRRSARATTESVLYMTSGGATSGPGTLIHQMLVAAGLNNFQEQPGWRSLPLERLAYEQPDKVALARFDSTTARSDSLRGADIAAPNPWSAVRHPIAQRQLDSRPSVAVDGAWTSCGGWFLLDAIEALAQ